MIGANSFTRHSIEKETYMKGVETKKELPPKQREELLKTLKARFEENMNRHKGLEWAKVQAKLEGNTKKLWSVSEMERTGGEPDVVGFDKKTGEYIFYDCSAESPTGRRSLCYDRQALDERKEHKPKNNAIDMAAAMGIELLTEEEYRKRRAGLQHLLRSENSVVPSFVIAATTMSSSITTVQNLTTLPGRSAAR
jgi:hypothetical protein